MTMSNVYVQVLAAAMRDPAFSVRNVSVHHNAIGERGGVALAESLGNSTFIGFNFGDNRVGDATAFALATAIRSPATADLIYLNIHHTGMSAAGASAIASAITDTPHCVIADMDLKDNRLGDDGCAAIATAVAAPFSPLKRLNLEWNGIGNYGAVSLGQALASPHCQLTYLGETRPRHFVPNVPMPPWPAKLSCLRTSHSLLRWRISK